MRKMKTSLTIMSKHALALCLIAAVTVAGKAQTGAPYIHDPSTIAE